MVNWKVVSWVPPCLANEIEQEKDHGARCTPAARASMRPVQGTIPKRKGALMEVALTVSTLRALSATEARDRGVRHRGHIERLERRGQNIVEVHVAPERRLHHR